MDQKDLEALVAALAPIIKEFVRDQLAAAVDPLQRSLADQVTRLESRADSIGESADQNRLLDLPRLLAVDDLVVRVAALEGRAAATPDQLLPLVNAAVGAAVGALPKAVDGKDGLDGAPGPTPGQIKEMVQDAVGVAVAALPKAVDGKDGLDGAPGVGLAAAFQDGDGHLVVTLSNGQVEKLGVVKGKDGADGQDGFGFEDLQARHDGGRSFTLEFARGTEVKTFKFTLPLMLYRGIWQAGEFDKGDVVTRAGSAWVALADATPADEPGSGSKIWQLAVKRGQDGKDGQVKPPVSGSPVKVGA